MNTTSNTGVANTGVANTSVAANTDVANAVLVIGVVSGQGACSRARLAETELLGHCDFRRFGLLGDRHTGLAGIGVVLLHELSELALVLFNLLLLQLC